MDGCRKTALIFGINGQDGTYLAKLLCAKGYVVIGACPEPARARNAVLQQLPVTAYIPLFLDSDISIHEAIDSIRPDELYNLAGPSRVMGSFRDPAYYMRCCGVAVQTMLEAVHEYVPACRVFQAGSSMQYAAVSGAKTEASPMYPANPYGLAKQVAYMAVQYARRVQGTIAVNGILFNHESPLRPDDFVSQKIARAVMRMWRNEGRSVHLGNRKACRDWSHAEDIVYGMWLSLQQDSGDDYVFASGVAHSVEYMVHRAAELAGLPRPPRIFKDKACYRNELDIVQTGVTEKAQRVLGWTPRWTFDALLRDLLRHA